MGLCCCCCCGRSKPENIGHRRLSDRRVDKQNSLIDVNFASNRTKTASGCPIETRIKYNLFTEKQFEDIRVNQNLDKRVEVVTKSPFSDFTKITDHLFLTGYFGLSKENITKNNVKCILTIAHELPKFKVKGIECIRLPVEDSYQEDISLYFNEISDKINENTQKNIKTVIHCMAGARRSVTFVIAYLMKYKKMNLKEAFTYVFKRRRVLVAVNTYFFEQLISFERKLFGNNSTKLIEKKGIRGRIPDFFLTEFPELIVEDTPLEKIDESDTLTRLDSGPVSIISLVTIVTEVEDSQKMIGISSKK